MENNQEENFESLVKELDTVVKALENKEISLDDAVKNYTKGVMLSKKCYEILDNNEKLVTLQMTENGLEKFGQE